MALFEGGSRFNPGQGAPDNAGIHREGCWKIGIARAFGAEPVAGILDLQRHSAERPIRRHVDLDPADRREVVAQETLLSEAAPAHSQCPVRVVPAAAHHQVLRTEPPAVEQTMGAGRDFRPVRSLAEQAELQVEAAGKFRLVLTREDISALAQGHLDPRQRLKRYESVAVQGCPGEARRQGIGVEHAGGRHLKKPDPAEVAEGGFGARGGAGRHQHQKC